MLANLNHLAFLFADHQSDKGKLFWNMK